MHGHFYSTGVLPELRAEIIDMAMSVATGIPVSSTTASNCGLTMPCSWIKTKRLRCRVEQIAPIRHRAVLLFLLGIGAHVCKLAVCSNNKVEVPVSSR